MPETTGAAMDVPDQAAYCPLGSVLQTPTPGAMSSYSIKLFGTRSQFEKLAMRSPVTFGPEAMTPSTQL